MALDFNVGTDTQDKESNLPDTFFQGVNFLGKPTSVSLTGQEPGQSASPSAGGAPVGPSGSPPPLTSVTGGGQSGATEAGGIPSYIALALKGAGFGENALRYFSQFGTPSAEAFQTPSGQFTTSAPEVLRGLQFPEATGLGEIPGASIPSGQAGAGFDFGGLLGPGISAAGSLLGLEEAIRTGNYAGVAGPAVNLGTLAASQLDLIPTALTSLTGAGIPFAAGLAILTNILTDELADPGGRKSAVQDFNQMMSQQVPGEARTLQLAASLNPLISDSLSTEQAMQLFQIARAGVKSEGLLADPLGRQGKEKAGVKYGEFPGLLEAVQGFTPQAWLATVRLQDLLAKRGVTPDQLATADSPAADLYGVMRTGPGVAEEQQFFYESFPSAGRPNTYSPEGPSLWLSPDQLLSGIGHYAGFNEPLYRETAAGVADPKRWGSPLYYSPATEQAISGIQPGSYESGLRAFLESQPGYAGSPLASIWGAEAPAAPASADPNTVQSQVAAEFSPAPQSAGGEEFKFDQT